MICFSLSPDNTVSDTLYSRTENTACRLHLFHCVFRKTKTNLEMHVYTINVIYYMYGTRDMCVVRH